MVGLLPTATVLALLGGPIGQHDPLLYPTCKDLSVSLTPEASEIKIGKRPEFSVAISNDTDKPLRVLDVRHGRRVDLLQTYFELFVARHKRVVEIPVVISDPGPVSAGDFIELQRGQRVEISRIGYTRALETLSPGRYDAYILFWRDPSEPPTTRCRSTSARFTVLP